MPCAEKRINKTLHPKGYLSLDPILCLLLMHLTSKERQELFWLLFLETIKECYYTIFKLNTDNMDFSSLNICYKY